MRVNQAAQTSQHDAEANAQAAAAPVAHLRRLPAGQRIPNYHRQYQKQNAGNQIGGADVELEHISDRSV
jgi:hypothetical protein